MKPSLPVVLAALVLLSAVAAFLFVQQGEDSSSTAVAPRPADESSGTTVTLPPAPSAPDGETAGADPSDSPVANADQAAEPSQQPARDTAAAQQQRAQPETAGAPDVDDDRREALVGAVGSLPAAGAPLPGEEAAPSGAEDQPMTAAQQAALPPAGQASVEPGPAEPAPGSGSDREADTGPSFDVVRVERGGETVVAGRAEPGSEVTVTRDGEEIGRVTADRRGEFVILPEEPLPPGDHELELSSRDAAGREQRSRDVVVVVVPETPTPGAAASAREQTAGEETAETQTGEGLATGEQTTAGGPTPSGTLDETTEAADAMEKPQQPLAILIPREGAGPSRMLQGAESGIAAGDFVLESVYYDETGFLRISGQVPSGERVFAYVDDGFVGEGLGDDGGRWLVTSNRPVAIGLHRLRVDRVDQSGKVLARVETPFARSSLLVSLPERDRFVVVQPGNSLWRIARRAYGRGLQYSVIFQANRDQIRDEDLIYPGQIFVVPTVN